MTGIWRLRALVLVLVGALGVHQARYLLVPPDRYHDLVAVHGYLVWLMPLVAGLLFVATVQLAARIRYAERPELPSPRVLWLTATVSLLAVFVVQEAIELTVAHGYLPGPGELADHVGWQLVPLAAAVGGAIALLLGGAAAAVRSVLARRAAPGKHRLLPGPFHSSLLRAPRGSVLARNLAGRAPPLRS